MDGENRRFEVFRGKHGQAQVILIKGNEFFGFRRKAYEDLCIYDIKRAVGTRGDMAFDPRTLGLSDTMVVDTNCRSYLWYDGAHTVKLDGVEKLGNATVSRVKATRGNVTSTYWIQEPGFQVHRRLVESEFARIDIISTFSSAHGDSPFPTRVEALKTANGKSWNTVWNISEFEVGIDISPERFTVAAMDLPIGTVLSDYRINRIVGYWDGQGVSQEPIAMVTDGGSRALGVGSGAHRPWLFALGSVVVICVVGWIVRRRWQLRVGG
jgi:hypothetical protein